MKIQLTSVIVNDQSRAERFYCVLLGFRKQHDISMGEFRWLTVVSPEGHADVELLLEPCGHPAAKAYQEALFRDGIPLTMFFVDDIHAEHERLKTLGVKFKTDPTPAGPVTIAVFDDTCGNWIQLVQK